MSGRFAQALARFGGRVLRTVDIRRSETERSLPRVRIESGGTVSALVLHVVVALLALGCALLLRPTTILVIAAVAGAVLMAARPANGLAALYALVIGVGFAYVHEDPWSARPFLLLLGVPAMVLLGALTQSLPWSARVEWAALRAVGARFAIIECGALGLALVAAALAQRDVDGMWLAVCGAIALGIAAWSVRAVVSRGPGDEGTAPLG